MGDSMSKSVCKLYINLCVIEKNCSIYRNLANSLNKDRYKVCTALQDVGSLFDMRGNNKRFNEKCFCDVCLLGISPKEKLKRVEEDLATIKKHFPDLRVIILSPKLDEELVYALSKNADGYVLNDISAEALMRYIDLVMLGEKVFPTAMTQFWRKPAIHHQREKGLSKREVQVLNCLVNGDSNKVIANNLSITDATVKVHLKAILKKLSVSNRTQAALWAVNNNISGNDNDGFFEAMKKRG